MFGVVVSLILLEFSGYVFSMGLVFFFLISSFNCSLQLHWLIPPVLGALGQLGFAPDMHGNASVSPY